MRSIKRRDTRPELLLRSALHRRGYRFRVDFPIPVEKGRFPRADIAFTRQRLAVFVDGCFWHGCTEHSKPPAKNSGYWGPKIARNIERDEETNARLETLGWRVIRVWEHVDLDAAVEKISKQLRDHRASCPD
jgi:DNA mismatch endonuclease (patch repair protein)